LTAVFGRVVRAAIDEGPADGRWREFCMGLKFTGRIDAWIISCSN
jgi:hypothetical protein